jgi:hypothetical protein
MAPMTQFHRITLPFDQAIWWRDIARDCGLVAMITETVTQNALQVTVRGEGNEIEIAWQLFHEHFNLLINR